MSNIFQRSLADLADHRLSNDSYLLAEMWQLQIRLNCGHFAQEWVDALMQTHRDRYDVYDAYGFAMLWSALLRGEICHSICEIHEECGSNRDLGRNGRILSSLARIKWKNGQYVRCNAEFTGGLADADGYFRWVDPLHFGRHLCGDHQFDALRCSTDTVIVEARELPLEVGYTDVGTSYGHIFSERGLASWPYGSSRIYLFCLSESADSVYSGPTASP
jgi:hypothetical protein